MKKIFFFFLLMLGHMAFSVQPHGLAHFALPKGEVVYGSKEERGLVNTLWHLILCAKESKDLKPYFRSDFLYLNTHGEQLHRLEYIQEILKVPRIQAYKISNLKLIKHKDILLAYYIISVKNAQYFAHSVPSSQLTVFQKENGHWKVLSMTDLDVFNM